MQCTLHLLPKFFETIGTWKDNFVEMGRKTVIRRLAKYLPLSIEFQTAAALDGMAEAGKDQNIGSTIIDGEFTVMPEEVAGIQADADGVIESPGTSATDQQAIGYSKPQILDMLLKAKTADKLDEAAALIESLPSQADRAELNAKYEALNAELQQ
ncbi:MAG: recombinase RecT [Comamonadaceae bacterium]|nr:recombinase RecT [Comamonadaceae bacterium]